jgi:hypothetical protein
MKVKPVNNTHNTIVYTIDINDNKAIKALKKTQNLLDKIDKKINRITIKALCKVWLVCKLENMIKRLKG